MLSVVNSSLFVGLVRVMSPGPSLAKKTRNLFRWEIRNLLRGKIRNLFRGEKIRNLSLEWGFISVDYKFKK
jgi:hypothetical protein